MIGTFSYSAAPVRIEFGAGVSGRIGELVAEAGFERALVLSTPEQAIDARTIVDNLGRRCAGLFSGATVHTPVAVTRAALDHARDLSADCLVAFGGGSTTGLGKAISCRTGLPQFVIPTTYVGSEVTPILGETENGIKTVIRDPRILPGVVLYDPDLTHKLPARISIVSGLNAIAHAAEGLYARDRNPVSSLMAAEALRTMRKALPLILLDSSNSEARSQALYGAWLCGTVLGSVGMSLHHKLCHTLGGMFDLPHAELHAVMLPHTIGYNAKAVPELLAPLIAIFGSAGGGLSDFCGSLGAPRSLQVLGLTEANIDAAAREAVLTPYWNPRPVDEPAIAGVLRSAWEGRRPAN